MPIGGAGLTVLSFSNALTPTSCAVQVHPYIAASSPALPTYNSLGATLQHLRHQDGWRGLWRGHVPNLADGFLRAGMCGLGYFYLRQRTQAAQPAEPLTYHDAFFLGAFVSAVTAAASYPIQVVRTRMHVLCTWDIRACSLVETRRDGSDDGLGVLPAE